MAPKPEHTAHNALAAEQVIAGLRADLAHTQAELSQTNSEILQLTLELEERVEARTAELARSQAALLKHKEELEKLVEARTAELKNVNTALRHHVDELRVSEARFKSLVTTIPDIVYRIDPHGKFLYLNQAIQRLGYEPADLIGRHFSDIILPSDFERVSREHALRRCGNDTGTPDAPAKLFDERRTGERRTIGLEVRLVAKDTGDARYGFVERLSEDVVFVEVNSSGLYEVRPEQEERAFLGTVGVIRDISARKRVEFELIESESRLRTILDYTEAGIIVINPDNHTIVDANPAAVRMIGAPTEDIVGARCHEFICPSKLGACPVTDKKQVVDRSERVLLNARGQEVPIYKTVATIMLKGTKHLLESFVDISEIKKAQEAMRAAKDHLEEQVDARTLALRQANLRLQDEIIQRKEAEYRLQSSLEQLQKSQSQLIMAEKMGALGILTAGIAHELNNPMMGMLNFIQYCIRHTAADDRRFPVLTDAERETRRCIDIVRNLLTFSRVGPEDSEARAAAPLGDLVRRCLSLLKYKMEKSGVTVTLRDEAGLEAPVVASALQQVFLNLMGNALDAVEGAPNGQIDIDICRSDDWAVVTITDNGPGVAEVAASKVFDPFYTTKPPGKGTGLGLSVSRGIIKDHGGQLTFLSNSTGGAAFEVRLPITTPRR